MVLQNGGVTSDGVYYDDHLVEEFDDLQKTVEGGQLSGYVYLDDVENGLYILVDNVQLLALVLVILGDVA